MGWTAKITDKKIINDVVSIIVEYTDGENVATKQYKTSTPETGWLERLVGRDIKRIEELYKFDVVVGSAIEPVYASKVVVDTEISEYEEAKAKLDAVKDLISLGIVNINSEQLTDIKMKIGSTWAKAIGVTVEGVTK